MHEPLCEVLLEKLCSAVQKVQEQYASGQEVIKDGEPVNQLCQSVDEIFSHGLREGILNWASGSETTYWPLVVKITYKEVLQSISRIPSIKNDRERCQVWIRLACQENSLGSYLNIVTQDEKLLTDFYQPHAFVFDKEKVDTAKNALLYGLSHLDFNISLNIPRNHQSSVTASKIPEKSSTSNSLTSSLSSMPSYTNSVASSSLSIPKGKDGAKKKKKVKSSVAVIADSLDDGSGIMTSVEKYLYNMSTSQEESNMNNQSHNVQESKGKEKNLSHQVEISQNMDTGQSESLATKASKDNEGFTDHMQQAKVSHEKSFVTNDIEDGLQNVTSLSSLEESCPKTEVSTVEKLGNKVKNISIGIKDSELNNKMNTKDNELNNKKGFSPTNNDHSIDSPLYASSDNSMDSPQMDHSNDNSSSNNISIQNQPNEEKQFNDNNPFEQGEEKTDNEIDYQVSRAHFEYGTPTEHDSLDEKNHFENSPDNDEDFNFVPGIHKTDPWRSHSGSFNSLTGSGSFNIQNKPETGETRRSSTIDSKTSMSSSIPNDPWRYVTSSLSSIERKDSKADNMSIATEDSLGDLAMFEELLGMSEDHFASPESFMGLSSSEELHHAIVSCKEMIKSTQNPEEKKKLVKRLIQLRIKQQEHKDDTYSDKKPDARKILGHQFVKEEDTRSLSNILCDRCGKWIWTMWQSLFTCQDCQFHCHRKCMDMVRRHCASRKVSVSSYSLSIAPEGGLHAQQYKCVECRKMISLTKSGQGEARLCDYSGQYFCEDCHWNDQVVIPARIVHNWDFGAYKVSRQTKQFLDLMAKKPILDLDQLNPALFKFVGELRDIKRYREEILIMKKYFMSCRSALESKLLLHLQDRQHFVDNSSSYSLQDLLEVEGGTMLPFITRVHSLFLTHIKSDCELCRAKGFVCEICRANEIIFAFDPHAIQCTKCRTVFHRLCFKKDSCPKCQRIQKRIPK